MRTPRFNMHPTQTKVGVMTGGVKENKSQLQLNIGDLIRGVNYQEVDGVYKGYLSLEGYEVTDGTALASSINVPIIEDYGVDRFTYLLLEGDSLVDKSNENTAVTVTNVIRTTSPYYNLYLNNSWYFFSNSSISFSDFDLSTNSFCIECIIYLDSLAEDSIIYQAGTDIKLYVEAATGAIKLDLNDSDVTHTFGSVLSTGSFTHLGLRRIVDDIYLSINGGEDLNPLSLTASYDILNTATSSLIDIRGYLSQYRISIGTFRRINGDFPVPTIPYSDASFSYTKYADAAREARRAAIKKVGDASCTGEAIGGYKFEDTIYGIRNNSTDAYGTIWKATGTSWAQLSYPKVIRYSSGNKNTGTEFIVGETITGDDSSATGVILYINQEGGSWSTGDATGLIVLASVTGAFNADDILSNTSGATSACVPSTYSLGKDGRYKFLEGRFDLFSGLQRQNILFFASGVSYPCYITNDTVYPILHPDLPDNAASGNYARCLAEFKNRLWLGYPDGRLTFSNVGDPTDFDSTTFSGTIYLEDEILDLVVGTGDALFVFCRNSIQVVKALSSDASTQIVVDYLFSNTTLINNTEIVEGTAIRLFDDIVYVDDRGLTSISATDAYGDFSTKSYSKSVQNSLLANFDNIIGATVNREYNQYRLFFNDGSGIIFTFEMKSIANSMTTLVKGATFFQYNDVVTFIEEDIFGCTNGYIYLLGSGTSFNGKEIESSLSTSFYSYNSPTTIKKFKEVYLEGLIPYGIDLYIKPNFDYKDYSYTPATEEDSLLALSGLGGVYGEGEYGSIRYGSSENQTPLYYINGYGVNVSFTITVSSKYSIPHLFSSIVVQYSLNGRKM